MNQKIGKTLFGILQIAMGIFFIWGLFHNPFPPFDVAKTFFNTLYCVVVVGLSILMLRGGIKNIWMSITKRNG